MPVDDGPARRRTAAATASASIRCSPRRVARHVPWTVHEPRHPRRVRTAAPCARLPVRRRQGRWLVEDRSSGSAATSSRSLREAVTLRDRNGSTRQFRFKPGGFLIEGKPVTLVRAEACTDAAAPSPTAVGASGRTQKARAARASRIWVEGRHDAELVRARVGRRPARARASWWSRCTASTTSVAMVAEFEPAPQRRLGILVDHLVAGSKEDRLAGRSPARTCSSPATRSSTCGPGSGRR